MKKRLLVLVIYCIPCLVSLLLLIEYKGRTNYVAEEIKHIASYIKEPERLIISEETLNQLKIKNFPNDILEKLAEKKSGKATGKETFFNDIRGMILNDSGKELIGMDYSNFESKILTYAKTDINLIQYLKNWIPCLKEPERFIINEVTLINLKKENINNDVLEILSEIKDWEAKEKESFLNDFKKRIFNQFGETLTGMDYFKFEKNILTFAKTEINLIESSKISEEFELLLKDRKNSKELIKFFILHKKLGTLNEKIMKIDEQICKIWMRNSIIITLMVFLPYILLGFRLAFGSHVELSLDDRKKAAWRNWAMKTVVACVILIGWMYILNPIGRGATTLDEYFIIARVVEDKTTPIYIATKDISNTLAGFLGWYLYLLLYFFCKLYQNDVKSGRVYRFLFGKFLFTYGIALTSSSFFGDETQAAMFLIGFFPLSAVSIIKEYGLKATKGITDGKTGLSELPSISTWHILRLEEEGIDSIPTLANSDLDELNNRLPNVMIPFIYLWIDVAQLYTIIGGERYQKIKAFCQTASEFIRIASDPDLQGRLKDCEIENSQEIINLLNRTFKEKIISQG